jgi:PD-(D/E)XK nuclease superfamily
MSEAVVPPIEKITPKVKQRRQIHVSGINMANDCGQRFLFRYILGVKSPPNAFLLVGKSTDESVTQDLDHKIATGELLPRADVLEISAAKFEQEQKNEPIELDAEEKKDGKSLAQVLGEAKDKAVCLSGLHHDEAAPKIQAVQTRRRFSVDMDTFLRSRAKELHRAAEQAPDKYAAKLLHGQAQSLNAAARDGVDFVGEQDVVERLRRANPANSADSADLLVIRDTKTSAKSPTPSFMDGNDKAGTADESEQLTAYAVASHVIDGKLPDRMVLDYLVRTNAAKPTIKYLPTATTRSMDDVQVFLNRFTNLIHAMKTGVFVPANQSWWGCSEKWCGYAGICPYFKRPKTVVS